MAKSHLHLKSRLCTQVLGLAEEKALERKYTGYKTICLE